MLAGEVERRVPARGLRRGELRPEHLGDRVEVQLGREACRRVRAERERGGDVLRGEGGAGAVLAGDRDRGGHGGLGHLLQRRGDVLGRRGGRHLDERQRDRRDRHPVARQHGRGGGHVELLACDRLDALRGDAVEADVALDGGLVDRRLQLGERGVQRGGIGLRDDADLAGGEERLDPRDRVEGLVLGLGDRGRPVDGKARRRRGRRCSWRRRR